MINLEKKLNIKSASPPPPPFKKSHSCAILPPPFLKRFYVREWGFLNYELANQTQLMGLFFKKIVHYNG